MTQPSNLPPPVAKPRRSRLVTASIASAFVSIVGFLLFAAYTRAQYGDILVPDWLRMFFIAMLVGSLFMTPFLVTLDFWISRGRRFVWGIAVVSLAISALFIVLLCSSGGRMQPDHVLCKINLHQIHIALCIYYHDNNRNPPSLAAPFQGDELFHNNDLRCLQCPSDHRQPMVSKFEEQLCSYRYIYYSNCSPNDAGVNKRVWVFEKRLNHKRFGIGTLFMDGHTEFLPADRLVAALKRLAEDEKLSDATRRDVREALEEVMAQTRTRFPWLW